MIKYKLSKTSTGVKGIEMYKQITPSKGVILARIFCDGIINFIDTDIYSEDAEKCSLIAKNFNLFYDNIN